MKRSNALGALVALTLPVGIAGTTLAEQNAAAPGLQPAQELVGREVAAFNAHDAAAVARFYAPSAALTVIPSGTVLAKGAMRR